MYKTIMMCVVDVEGLRRRRRHSVVCPCFSGVIRVNDNTQLDYELMSDIRLIVEATAGANRAYATVWVHLQDVNDNPPLFSQDRYVTAVYEGGYTQ